MYTLAAGIFHRVGTEVRTQLRLSLPLLVAISLLTPRTAYAYIDPGTVSMLIQGLFAVVFGAATAWIARPWQILKSLLRRRKPVPSANDRDSVPPGGNRDTTTKL